MSAATRLARTPQDGLSDFSRTLPAASASTPRLPPFKRTPRVTFIWAALLDGVRPRARVGRTQSGRPANGAPAVGHTARLFLLLRGDDHARQRPDFSQPARSGPSVRSGASPGDGRLQVPPLERRLLPVSNVPLRQLPAQSEELFFLSPTLAGLLDVGQHDQ